MLSLDWLPNLTSQMLFVLFFRNYYQPPRGNPWKPYKQHIIRQPSAHPHRNWTRRVHSRAGAPAACARVLKEGLVDHIVNTYDLAGDFNFGPTYLDWLAVHDRPTYRKIIAADRRSLKYFGHGSAIMLAAHGHLILPLCNDNDLETQVIWAIENFKHHFKRDPEAAWLPEAAVSKRVLIMLARHGIKRTILRRGQAKQFRQRKMTDGNTSIEWISADNNGHRLDERRAYWVDLSPEPPMSIIFYHEQVSQEISFPPEHLATDAPRLAEAMVRGLNSGGGTSPKLRVAAGDGETWGEHIPHGFMGLAKAIEIFCAEQAPARLINTGAFVDRAPPEWEVELHDKTSWSCLHGIDRWFRDCGCGSDPNKGGHQLWRQPMRVAFDWLRDQCHIWFGSREGGGRWFIEPWAARNGFIQVLLHKRSAHAVQQFVERYCQPGLTAKQIREAIMIMEIMKDMMSMYTSCGWFFDSMGLEMGQNLLFAYRAILQAKRLGLDWEGDFIVRLEMAPCYHHGTAAVLWNKKLRPFAVQEELRSLLRELVKLVDIDTIKRAKELADVATTLSVDWWKLQDKLLRSYGRIRDQLIGDGEQRQTLLAEFLSLARKLRLETHVLEDAYQAQVEVRELTQDIA